MSKISYVNNVVSFASGHFQRRPVRELPEGRRVVFAAKGQSIDLKTRRESEASFRLRTDTMGAARRAAEIKTRNELI